MAALGETVARDEHRALVVPLGYTPRQAERTVLHQVVRAFFIGQLAQVGIIVQLLMQVF